MTLCTLFDLDMGDRFTWNKRKYTLLRFDEDDVAIVLEDGVEWEQRFNPYAMVQKI